MRVGRFNKSINFNSGLNSLSTVPSYWATATAYKGVKIVTIWQNDKRVFGIFWHANFWVDQLRGFGVAKGRILAFSIDLLRRL